MSARRAVFQPASRVPGDEPVGGVDGQVAAAGQAGVVAGALDVRGAQRVGLGGPVLELGGHGEGCLDGERGEGADQQLAGGLVQAGAGDGGADRAGVFDAVALAQVGGPVGAAAAVVADSHPGSAATADDDALQQRGAFAGRPGGTVPAVGGGVGGQLGDVGLVLAQGDVSGVGAGDEGGPLLAGQLAGGVLPAGPDLVGGPAVGERPGVAGLCSTRSTAWWRSGCQSTSPLRGPFWCRQGNDSPAARNAFTTAVADPAASNVVNRCRSAPWMAVSGSRMTCPAAS